MTETELLGKIAQLEFVHDQMTSEIEHLDKLLKAVGFPSGIESAKAVALEMIENRLHEDFDYD